MQPRFQKPQGVVPKGIDFDRLASPRRDNPVTDLGVHPGELISLLSLAQEAVARIDADAEARAAAMMLDNVEQRWQKQTQGDEILGVSKIAVQGVEKPQRGIGGVVQALAFALGKHVGDQAIASIV